MSTPTMTAPLKGPFLFAGCVVEGLGLLPVIAFHGWLTELVICMTITGIGNGMGCRAECG